MQWDSSKSHCWTHSYSTRSFQLSKTRQLNIWGFEPTIFGYQNDGAWRHKCFIRGQPELLNCMKRVHKATRSPLSSAPTNKRNKSKKRAVNETSSGASTRGMTTVIKQNKNEDMRYSNNQASSTGISATDFELSCEKNQFPTSGKHDEVALAPKLLTESDTFEPEEVLQFLLTYFEWALK